MKNLAILILLGAALSAHAAEPRGAAPALGAAVAPQQPAGVVSAPLAPTPSGVSRQPAGASAPRLQPVTGSAMRGQVAPASPVPSAPQLPVAGTPSSATRAGAMPSAPALPAMPAPQQPALFVPVPLAPKAPSTPLPPDSTPSLSDYSVGVGSQASEGKWTFTIRNVGLAHPKSNETTGSYDPSKHHISFSVGKPCATMGDWHEYPGYPGHLPLPKLGPGEQASVSFSMEKAHINNGCKIKAEIKGPVNDINLTNNLSITHTKAVFLPDLIITNLPGQGKWPGGSIVIKNTGNGPAGPSTFRFYCVSKEPGLSCGTWGEKLKSAVDRDMPVPALKPGEGYSVMKPVSGVFPGTPTKVSWTGEIDSKKEVAESDEQNNHDALNQGQYFW